MVWFVFGPAPSSAQTQTAGSCPNDQDIVIVLARDHVNLLAPDSKSEGPVNRTWEAQAVEKYYRVQMQFGPGVPEPAIPNGLKGKRMVLFFDCAQNDRQDQREGALWSHEDVLQPTDSEDGSVFKIGELSVTLQRDPEIAKRLGKYAGRRVRIGLMCPRHRFTKLLFNDGAAPKAVVFSAPHSK